MIAQDNPSAGVMGGPDIVKAAKARTPMMQEITPESFPMKEEATQPVIPIQDRKALLSRIERCLVEIDEWRKEGNEKYAKEAGKKALFLLKNFISRENGNGE